jgi:hypothetical protein
MDDAASDKDVWSWAFTTPKHTFQALAYPPDAPELTLSVEAEP